MRYDEVPEKPNSHPQIVGSHCQVKVFAAHQTSALTSEAPPDLRTACFGRVGLRYFRSCTKTRTVRNRLNPKIGPLCPYHWPNGQTMQKRLDPRIRLDLELSLDTTSEGSEIR